MKRIEPCCQAQATGFTYIGVLLAIAMVGFLLAAASQVWHTAQRREREAELLFAGNEIRRALAQYYFSSAGNGERYPRRLEDLLKDPRQPTVRRYLRKLYPDPITGSAEWGLVKSGDFITGVYSLSDEEPLKSAGFSFADRGFEGKTKYSEWIFFPMVRQGAGAAAAKGSVSTQQTGPAPQQTGPALQQTGPASQPPGLPEAAPGVVRPR